MKKVPVVITKINGQNVALPIADSETDAFSSDMPAVQAHGNIPVGFEFNEFTFSDYIEKQFFPDVPPNITLAANPAGGLRERGVSTNAINLTATVTKTKHNITTVEFHRTAPSPQLLHAMPPPSPYVHNAGILSGLIDTSFRATARDIIGLFNNSGTINYNFINPMYIGYVPDSITIDSITQDDVKTRLTKRIVNRSTQTFTYPANLTDIRFAAWVPLSIPNWVGLSRVLDWNQFDITGGFSSKLLGITSAAEEISGIIYLFSSTFIDDLSRTVTFQF